MGRRGGGLERGWGGEWDGEGRIEKDEGRMSVS